MTFQVLDYKGKNFIDLNGDDYSPTKPTYSKGGTWLNLIGHSNMLCMCAIRTITNHALIGEYHLRFFLKESFTCPCRKYPIKTWNHILNSCKQFRNYWNPKRESLKNIIAFLESYPGVFSFHEGITWLQFHWYNFSFLSFIFLFLYISSSVSFAI